MKIGILATAYKEQGGVYQYVLALIESLANYKSSEHSFYLIVHNDSDTLEYIREQFDLPLIILTRSRRHKVYSIFIKLIKLLSLKFKYLKNFGIVKQEFNSLDEFNLQLVIIPYPSLEGYFTDLPYILVIHDVQQLYFPRFFKLEVRIERWITYKYAAKNAITTLCDSNFTKKDIVKHYGVRDDQVRTIPLFIPSYIKDWSIETDNSVAVKRKYNLPDKFLYYPAQFWYHKNHLNLIEAVYRIISRYHDDLHLVLSGTKKNNFDNTIKKIKKLGIENNVHYIGYVAEEDMPYIYRLATALVYASLFDPNGIPIYEAFFMGCPVVSSNVCALPEQIGNAGLLFNPIDIEDISDKLYKIWTDDELRKELSEKGFERVKNLNTDSYARMWIDIINSSITTSHAESRSSSK